MALYIFEKPWIICFHFSSIKNIRNSRIFDFPEIKMQFVPAGIKDGKFKDINEFCKDKGMKIIRSLVPEVAERPDKIAASQDKD